MQGLRWSTAKAVFARNLPVLRPVLATVQRYVDSGQLFPVAGIRIKERCVDGLLFFRSTMISEAANRGGSPAVFCTQF